MRKFLGMVLGFGLLINSAFAKLNSETEQSAINVLQALTKENKVKNFSELRLTETNRMLKYLEAKFTIEQAVEYQDQQLRGNRYVVKNVSKEAIDLGEEFGKGEKLLALICNQNVVAPNETGVVYLVEKIM